MLSSHTVKGISGNVIKIHIIYDGVAAILQTRHSPKMIMIIIIIIISY